MTKILDEYTSSVINQNQWKTLMQENCNEALMRCTKYVWCPDMYWFIALCKPRSSLLCSVLYKNKYRHRFKD